VEAASLQHWNSDFIWICGNDDSCRLRLGSSAPVMSLRAQQAVIGATVEKGSRARLAAIDAQTFWFT
jgi:hypothetical protein